MKFNALLCGRSEQAIDDFFKHMRYSFEIMTTSMRYDDVAQHLKYFDADVFIYCANNKSMDDMDKILTIKDTLSQKNIPFVLIGTKYICTVFEKLANGTSDLTLAKPMKIEEMQDRIMRFLQDWRLVNGPAGGKINSHTRKHVLVIDDNALTLKTIKESLHDRYDVATAISGKVAFRFLENNNTDLILLDYEMPEESGPEVLAKLRDMESTRNVPVVFLTGVAERDKIQKALVMKPQAYLLKPIERKKLLEIIMKYIG